MDSAARVVFPGYTVGVDDPAKAERLVDLGVGGFCLYGGEVGEIAALTADLQARAGQRLLFCADYEDGLASHCAGGTALPSNMGLAASGSEELAFEKGAITGEEARAIGVRWVFAPVCDLANSPDNPIVNTRAFSGDPGTVVRLARAYLRGLRSQGVLGCLKHFPGHGRTIKDSHLDLPAVEAARSDLDLADLRPFRELAGEAGSVMTAHLLVEAIERDPTLPCTLSPAIGRLLREDLKFKGLIATDALNMKAIADRFPEVEAARRALLSDADVVLVPADPERLVAELCEAEGTEEPLGRAVSRARARLDAALAEFSGGPPPDRSVVGCAKHLEAAERMAAACLAWARQPVAPLGGRLAYWEPEADSPEEWLGTAFVERLRSRGLDVCACDGKSVPPDRTLVVGCFLSPRAYTGRITWDPEIRDIVRRLALAGPAAMVSFGSPYAFEAVAVPGLCAFSRDAASQRAAADALAGKAAVSGRMPVALRPAA